MIKIIIMSLSRQGKCCTKHGDDVPWYFRHRNVRHQRYVTYRMFGIKFMLRTKFVPKFNGTEGWIRQKWHHEKWGSRRMLGCRRPLKIRDQERPFPALKSADRVIIYMYLQKSGFFEPPRSELLINRYL